MRRYFCLVIMIMFLGLVGFLAGCRAKLDTSSSMKRQQTDVIGLELRRADSLWGSSSERLTYKIEFYAPWEIAGQACNDNQGEKYTEARQNPATPTASAAPSTVHPADGLTRESGVGGLGAVKSIEISTEKVEGVSSITTTDSTYNYMKGDEHARDVSTVSEARQDNGTVATIAIVFAVAALIYLVIKSMLK